MYLTYSGSDQLKEVDWHRKNSHGKTKAVGLKRPNGFQLYDMSGNVLEWCMDKFSNSFYQECHDQGVVKDPLCEKETAQRRLNRGGGAEIWKNEECGGTGKLSYLDGGWVCFSDAVFARCRVMT